MTTPRRRTGGGTRRRSATPRRASEWFTTIVNETIESTDQELIDVGALVLNDEKKGMTIVRALVDLTLVLVAAGTGGNLAMGLLMVGTEALAALAVPDADQAADKGWMWRTQQVVSSSLANDRSQHVRIVQDLKSRRRFRSDDDEVILVFNAGTLSGAINIDGTIRLLALKS